MPLLTSNCAHDLMQFPFRYPKQSIFDPGEDVVGRLGVYKKQKYVNTMIGATVCSVHALFLLSVVVSNCYAVVISNAIIEKLCTVSSNCAPMKATVTPCSCVTL